MFASRPSPKHQQALVELALKPIRKMLEEMQSEGKDLTKIKLKKFQKTHHIQCRCSQCLDARKKNDPRLRGLLEDGFKVYIADEPKQS